MSLGGLGTFNKNLLKLMKSEAFRNSSDDKKLKLGLRLLHSKYGFGSIFGKVHDLLDRRR